MAVVNLPSEWTVCLFSDLVSSSFTGLVRSAQEQGEHLNFKYLKMNNLDSRGNFLLDGLTRVNAESAEVERYSLQRGDFIFNTRNSVELVGKCGVFDVKPTEPILFNNNLLKIKFIEVKPKLVAHWLNSPVGKRDLREITSATTSVAAIYQKQLFGLKLPLPPLAEQKVIAEKLDTLLAQVDNTKARLERIPEILKSFRQSVLAAAVSGKLTEEWRSANKDNFSPLDEIQLIKIKWAKANPQHNEAKRVLKRVKEYEVLDSIDSGDLPDGWSWQYLEDCVLMIVDCHNKTAPYVQSGIPLIRTSNIRDGQFIWQDLKFVDDNTYEYWSRRCPPEYGDLIFTREAPMGEVAIIPPNKKVCLGQRTMLIRPIESQISAKYLLLSIMDPSFKKRSDLVAVGTGVKHYRVGDVSNLLVPVPSRDEQTEIVRRVEELFAFADRIEHAAQAALSRVSNLTQSILAKAFRGELTLEWRAANPELISGEHSAEALLARIKAERAKVKPTKKAKA